MKKEGIIYFDECHSVSNKALEFLKKTEIIDFRNTIFFKTEIIDFRNRFDWTKFLKKEEPKNNVIEVNFRGGDR